MLLMVVFASVRELVTPVTMRTSISDHSAQLVLERDRRRQSGVNRPSPRRSSRFDR